MSSKLNNAAIIRKVRLQRMLYNVFLIKLKKMFRIMIYGYLDRTDEYT